MHARGEAALLDFLGKIVQPARENLADQAADSDKASAYLDLGRAYQRAENIDKAKFQAALAPAYADFAQRFGQANIDRIKNYR